MSIVTLAEYRTITKDTVTPDADATGAITEAQELVEAYLKRPLDAAVRTEQCLVYPKNRLYPLATPIASVTSPGGGSIVNGEYIRGVAVIPALLEWDETSPGFNYVSVTYTGGYTSITAPRPLKRAVAELACAIAQSSIPGGQYPVGATSVSLGDASVSFAKPIGEQGSSELDSYIPGLSSRIKIYRRRV